MASRIGPIEIERLDKSFSPVTDIGTVLPRMPNGFHGRNQYFARMRAEAVLLILTRKL